jgi:O-antigen ligase
MAVVRFLGRYLLGITLTVLLTDMLLLRRRFEALARWILLGACSTVLVSIAGFIVPSVGETTIRYTDRAQGFLNHPNQLAMLLVAVTPLALSRGLRRPMKLSSWLPFVIISVGVALTGSKANLLLLLIATVVFVLIAAASVRSLLKRFALAFGLGIGMAIVIVGGLATLSAVSPRTITTLELLLVDPAAATTVSSRTELWRTAIEVGTRNAFTGVGASNSRYFLPHDHAHNVFVEFFLTLGILGLLGVLALVGVAVLLFLAAVWQLKSKPPIPFGLRLDLIALPLGLLLYVASNQTSDSFGGTTLPIFWILIAMSLAHLSYVQTERQRMVRASRDLATKAVWT